jgi:hypothetical protein
MFVLLPRLVPIGFVFSLAQPGQAQLLTHHDLSYTIAKSIAEAAVQSCAAKGIWRVRGRGRSCRRGYRGDA